MATTIYNPRIIANGDGFYAMVVRVDPDGAEQIDPSFKARQFVKFAPALRAANRHIATTQLAARGA
jgi:hypothetical protein